MFLQRLKVFRYFNQIQFQNFAAVYDGNHSSNSLEPAKKENNKDHSVASSENRQQLEPFDAIKSAVNPIELLNSVRRTPNRPIETPTDALIKTFRTLFSLKRANQDISNEQIIRHPNFEPLCRKLLREAPKMHVDDVIEAIKCLNFLAVPANSQLMLGLVSLLSHQINDLTLKKIFFLNFLLPKLRPETKIVEAIQSGIIRVFEIQLPLQIDQENINECVDCFTFAVYKKTSKETIDFLVDVLCKKKLQDLSTAKTLALFYCLCYQNLLPPNWFELWKIVMDKLKSSVPEVDADEILSAIKIATKKVFHEKYLHIYKVDLFLYKAIKIWLEKSEPTLEEALDLQARLKRISFESRDLLQTIERQIHKDISWLSSCNANALFTIVQAFSVSSHLPSNFYRMRDEIMKNENLNSIDPNHTLWFRFTSQLLILCECPEHLLNYVFNRNYLDHYFHQENTDEKDYEILSIVCPEVKLNNYANIDTSVAANYIEHYIQNIYSNPIAKNLIEILGEKNVLSNVSTASGVLIQNLLKLNKITKQFEPFNEPIKRNANNFASIEDVACDANQKLVSVETWKKRCFFPHTRKLKGIYALHVHHIESVGVCALTIHEDYSKSNFEFADTKNSILLDQIETFVKESF